MGEFSSQELIARARVGMNLDASVPVRAWRVRRLDRPGDDYELVVFGEDYAAVGVAVVGATRGDVWTWAALPGHGPHLELDGHEAAVRAGCSEASQTELVWQPCRASQSPLYPLWEVRGAGGKPVYVNQSGVVWPELTNEGRGG